MYAPSSATHLQKNCNKALKDYAPNALIMDGMFHYYID